MSSEVWNEFQVPVVAGVLVDKLVMTTDDAWTFAAYASNGIRRPLWTALLWSMPLLGSCQLMNRKFAMGESNAYGIVVGDGQTVSAINPVLTEWLFQRHLVPSGTAVFAEVESGELHRGHSTMNSLWHQATIVAGLPTTILILAIVAATTSIRHHSVIFVLGLHLTTLLSNYCIASQSQNMWTGFTGDTEVVQLLILAPSDRWAVVSGKRNLIKMITTGSHVQQKPSLVVGTGPSMLALLILLASVLQGATWPDFIFIGLALALGLTTSKLRSKILGGSPTIRHVRISRVAEKTYRRRADLVEELSEKTNSDAWAYDCKLLTRRYISDRYKFGPIE